MIQILKEKKQNVFGSVHREQRGLRLILCFNTLGLTWMAKAGRGGVWVSTRWLPPDAQETQSAICYVAVLVSVLYLRWDTVAMMWTHGQPERTV